MSGTTRLLVLSGLSGSGKSVALHLLEDLGFYCIDNMPAALLKPFISHTVRSSDALYHRTAVGIDARNTDVEISSVPTLIDELRRSGIDCELIFLVADDEELLRRFAETRRAHPLSRHGESLREAIAIERGLLEPVLNAADLVIDTSRMGMHELREQIHLRVESRRQGRLAVLLESFGFKYGMPGDADFVFDARSLPNPFWEPSLRDLDGRHPPVIRFLEAQGGVQRYVDDIVTFIAPRLDEFRASNRRYLTIAVGCTGGQHRSVYIVEQLATRLAPTTPDLRVRHSQLDKNNPRTLLRT
jgi:UPF0042 nucleotide-binding protein